MTRHVSLYTVTREFGGPEEGGWWYNNHVLETSRAIPAWMFGGIRGWYINLMKNTLLSVFTHLKHGDIYSVLGGTDIIVFREEVKGENQTEHPVFYE